MEIISGIEHQLKHSYGLEQSCGTFQSEDLEVRLRENLVNKDNSITVLTRRLLSTK